MDRATSIIKERRSIAAEFDVGFKNIESLQTPFSSERYGHGYQSYPCLINMSKSIDEINEKRNVWMETLQDLGISTRPATHAVHMLSFYSKKYSLQPEDFPNAYRANQCSISLPLFHGMSENEISRVIDTVVKTAYF